MSDKMREALEWLADEMRSELTEDGASLPQWLVKSWLSRCDKALAEQPAQGVAVELAHLRATEVAYENLKASLIDAPPAPSVPDGWKLVPVNATTAMLEVLKSARIHEWSTTRAVYAAMLAAAPKPPHA